MCVDECRMCIHSILLTTIIKYLLSVYCAPGTVLDAWDTLVNKMKILPLRSLHSMGVLCIWKGWICLYVCVCCAHMCEVH